MEIPILREELRPPMISNVLSKLKRKKTITLWQNLAGERNWRSATLVKIDSSGRFIKFYSPPHLKAFEFNSREPVYFYENEKTLIFKSTIQFQTKMELEVRFPQQFMQEELRAEHRHIPLMGLEYAQFNIPHQQKKVYKKPILDYSSQGLSFLIGRYEFSGVTIGEKVELMEHIGARHPKNIAARINSICAYFDGESFSLTHYRIGLLYL